MSNKTYFITGGGTGGHIYPAFTIIENLLKEDDTEKIYYIGNPNNLEYDISAKYPEVEFLPIDISGMPRKISFAFIKWCIQLFFASLKAISYYKKYKPNALFATGGYVSAPAIMAANFLNKPYMIHDCDSVPGVVSKISAPNAKFVSVAFETSIDILKSKNIVFNGNPVRDAFFEITKSEAKNKLNIPSYKTVIFAMGGSQGARTINTAIIQLLKKLSDEMDAYIILQTGKKNYDSVISELESTYPEFKKNKNILVKPYFDEMVYPLKASDIVISRAGSVSLTEIMQCHAVSILIPYPYASQDHQRKNAKELTKKGLALYLEDEDCNSENLLAKIKELLDDEHKLEDMSLKIKEAALKNPAQEIVKQLKSIIK